ncbi:MAG TPA: SDR family NAD(P)-dependent oxidoreductase, partial [Ktedonobacteraceae bacterium]|nr:SDR family NAD(P)-dependent oxidoreductase [Ktedonobacteraceae bacterium]
HPCLIFVDSSGLGTRVVQRLRQEVTPVIVVEAGERFAQLGEQHFVLRPGVNTDYVALFRELSQQGHILRSILHCWNVTKDQGTASLPDPDPQLQTGFTSLLCLTRAIGSSLPETDIHLMVLSDHTQAVTGEEVLSPAKAPIVGLCKVISQEYPSITCQHIDVTSPAANSWTSTRMVESLVAECLATSGDLSVAYRGHTRWTHNYLPMRLEQSERKIVPFRNKGVYLIIGGLGEVGLLLAEYLAAKAQARLVLLDEAAFPASEQWSTWLEQHAQDDAVSQTIRRLQTLEVMGAQVQVLQADLTNVRQMRQIVEGICQDLGTLHGVLHMAGSSELQSIQDMDQTSYDRCFQPRLQSMYALEHALQETALDFCLLFSSLTAILGGVGCAMEAAISTYIDTFVLKKSQNSATPWISVNWDLWLTRENEQKFRGTAVARYMMSPTEGGEAFSRIITSQWIRMITSTGSLPDRVKQLERASSDQAFHAGPASTKGVRPEGATAYVSPASPVEQRIAEVWQRLLGFEQIGVHDNFFELHGHSLLGMQLISRLREMFQVNIPLARLFEGPTVAKLAEVVEELLIEEIEKLGEEEARLLV